MAKNPTGSASDRLPHPFNELLAAATVPPQAEFLVHSVKVVCGRQTETNCCCTAGARPGVYATEVNIQNITGQPAQVAKFFVPLINAGAVIGREPKFADPAKISQHTGELITLPPLAATMDDCCHIAELLLGGPPSGESALTIGYLTIGSFFELAVSAVYTATPLSGDGISIDVEYILPRRLGRGPGQG
ncbi:hypothetical protein ACVW1A_007146 [Bradyrhizobium sp. LB1.3]|uniref:hypothetical protein n=1 Tax=Bradyrhizobium sp. LB12.1 TaxID=3156327 RepID=UPI0033914694